MATHLNAFKDEAKEALAKARTELQNASDKFDELVTKLDEDQAEPAVEAPAPAPEVADPPVAPATAHSVTEARDSKGHFVSSTTTRTK